MSSTGAKGSQRTNKKTEKGFKYKEQKTAEVCPGLAHRTVRCSTGQCPVAHRTVWCASGATTTSAPTVACNSIKCATVRAEVRHALEGAPDSLQDLSGAPPDCPVAQKTEAPTVRIQRLGDVAGAPDCPVRHATAAFTKRLVWWLGL
jgi:hypothetical protein